MFGCGIGPSTRRGLIFEQWPAASVWVIGVCVVIDLLIYGAWVVSLALSLQEHSGIWALACDSDGIDGTEDNAGLAWNADTLSMNPNVDARVIADAFADDPVAAASEYGQDGSVTFRRDVEALLDREAHGAGTIGGRRELPRVDGVP